jgi:NADH-quinone oxidoreductase subunit L
MALVATDIKRVMAYSTVSQLGYMMLALGLGARGAAMFHLMNHAFFKALLFLAAGSVIHALGSQDLREMGGLGRRMKVTATTMLIAALSLSGFPLVTSGFWSKDEILSAAWDSGQYLVFAVALFTAFLTAFYMFRAWFLAFWGKPRWNAETVGHGAAHGHGHDGPRESPLVMAVPLAILAVPSVLSGFWGSPLFGNGFALFLEGHVAESGANWLVMGLSSAFALGGIGLAWAMYGARVLSPERVTALFGPAYAVLANRYWVDEAYAGIVRVGVFGPARAFRWFDVGVIDGAVNGVGRLAAGAGQRLRRIQTGQLQNYGWAMYAGALLIAAVALIAGR